VTSAEPTPPESVAAFPIRDYDLEATLTSGQAFRWQRLDRGWEGVIGARWLRVSATADTLCVQTAEPVSDWQWLIDYFQLHVELDRVLATFPDDPPMRAAVAACRGLRLLRQDPWECLASFLCSSSKQIVQIRQIIALLCERYGEALVVPPGHTPVSAFPTAARLAACTEDELWECKLGFRARNLSFAAQMVADGRIDLERLRRLDCAAARHQLFRLCGVGRKISDCVLLFAYGFQEAFPIDVWVRRALHQLYFPRRHLTARPLEKFTLTHFGPHAGYAQQYLFHYMRTKRGGRTAPPSAGAAPDRLRT